MSVGDAPNVKMLTDKELTAAIAELRLKVAAHCPGCACEDAENVRLTLSRMLWLRDGTES